MQSSILVTGGAGYIGSHIVWALVDRGYTCTVVDDLRAGLRQNLPASARLVEADMGDRVALKRLFSEQKFAAVIHCAGSIVVKDSIVDPLGYFENNVSRSIALLQEMVAAKIPALLFSSTAAVYGIPDTLPIPETAAIRPISPYGLSKAWTEQIIAEAARAHGLRYGFLRYFNVAGADPALRCGQPSHNPTHLIKLLSEVVVGKRKQLDIYGTDYPTRDGTCVRDYVHVSDLAEAHAITLEHLLKGGESLVHNVGYGTGYSVLEIVAAAEAVFGKKIPISPQPRRPADPPELIADGSSFRRRFGWKPQHDSLESIFTTALAWEETLHKGGA